MQFRHSFRSLETFEAVSRHRSVALAATELGVTQSAVSHQIRLLTEIVGERLVQKRGRGIDLTEAGERLARKLQPAFAEIVRSVGEAIGGQRDSVRLAVCSSFGPGWLIPRLNSFYATEPGFDLQLSMYARDPELTDAVADAFVTTLPKEKGFYSFLLIPEQLVAVATPELLASSPIPPLITTDLQQGSIGADWKAYCALSGNAALLTTEQGWRFASHYVLALEMVRAGLGAALVPEFIAARDLGLRRIVLLGDTRVPTHEDYHLCIKESRRSEPALDALIRWFKSQVPKASKA
ncbi:MAG: LysR family transcriptional regulator [Rhizobiaceae bacterium]|jgi:LysR family glycine cleavage system transcriptional activator|nr:LysR family transcriptional regulator [Rhizobiaceae bacterium]